MTDALIEAMARAMWMADVEPYDPADRIPFDEAPETARAYCLAEAAAALAVARLVIRAEALEEAAKIAEEHAMRYGSYDEDDACCHPCVSAIRFLKDTTT